MKKTNSLIKLLSQVFGQLLNTFLALGTLCLKYILALDKRRNVYRGEPFHQSTG